jgi:hypothetical protein
MANSCPPKEEALTVFLEKISEIASSNPAIRNEIMDIQESIRYGMRLRSGKVLKQTQSGKRRNRKED